VTHEQQRRRALEALDRILDGDGDADEVLGIAVAILAPLYDAVALDFVEAGRLVRGPAAGEPVGGLAWPIRFGGAEVARLTVAPFAAEDRAFLERVTTLISAHCLVGWDTGGERWEP
jgi:hypothetical protein